MRYLTAIAEWMAPRAKAVAAGLSAFAAGLLAALPEGVTLAEVLGIVVVTIGAASATYAVPNRPADPEE